MLGVVISGVVNNEVSLPSCLELDDVCISSFLLGIFPFWGALPLFTPYALLLGHRGVRGAVPRLHLPDVRAERGALPLLDAARRPAPRRPAQRGRRALPVAHDQR